MSIRVKAFIDEGDFNYYNHPNPSDLDRKVVDTMLLGNPILSMSNVSLYFINTKNHLYLRMCYMCKRMPTKTEIELLRNYTDRFFHSTILYDTPVQTYEGCDVYVSVDDSSIIWVSVSEIS
jgi:hypothetical protein